MMKMRAWLASACLAAAMIGCGGPEPTPDGGTDASSREDGSREDGGRDPCDGLTACTTLGTSCDGDDLVTCAVNADGCMAEQTTRCTTDDQVCDDSSGTAACVDPCSLIPAAERCDTLARACTDADTLEVCEANADGCYVRTVTECGDMPGGICDDTVMPMCATPLDPCAGTPDACTTAGTSCDGDSLVTCAPNAFGCLVETTTDCTERASGTCDATGTVAACEFTGDPCAGITECTAPAEPSCLGGPELVTCAADGFGCMVETRVDCTAAAFGFCDETATGPDTCATAATDPCMGMTECGTAASLTCSSDGTALVECAPNAFGCFVEERTVCSGSCSTASGTAECTDPAPGCPEAGTRVINCASGTVTGDTSTGTMANVGDYGDCAAGTDYAGREQYWRFEHTGAAPVEVSIEVTSTTAEDLDLFVLDGAAGSCTAADPICLDGGLTSSADEEVVFRADPSDVAWVAYDMYDAPTATATYSMTVTCTPIVCGDGIVSAGEQCDDGGAADGNGCSATCTVEPNYICTGAPSTCVMAPAHAFCASARAITTTATFTDEDIALGGPRPQGTGCGTNSGNRSYYYAVTIPPMSGVDVTTDSDPDLVLLVQDACDATSCTLRTDSPESATLTNSTAAPVTRILSVHGYGATTSGTYDITFQYAVCGDGILSGGEACDDGGNAGGNGCSATCTLEPGYLCTGTPSTCFIAPPQSFCATARTVTTTASFTGEDISLGGPRPQGTGCSTNSGNRAAYYSVTVPPMTTVEVTTDSSADLVLIVQDACGATSCLTRTDTPEELDLVNSTGTAITRIVSVHGYSSTTTGTFDILFQYPVCGDGFIGAGEACDDTNAVGGDGCSSSCTVETGYSCFGTPSVCRMPATHSMCSGARAVTQPATTDTVAFTSEDLRAGAPSGRTSCGTGTQTTALFYTVTIPPATAATITATPSGTTAWNLVLAETADCAATTCGTVTNAGGTGAPESRRLVNTGTTAVTRTFLVRSATTAFSTFDIAFTYTALGCGDGFVDAPETCDDGGTASGNGCSSTCQVEPGWLCSGTPSVCATPPAHSMCSAARAITANASFTGEPIALGGPRPMGTGCGTNPGNSALFYSVSIPARTSVSVVTASSVDRVLLTQDSCASTTCTYWTDASPESVVLTNLTDAPVTRIVAISPYSSGVTSGTFDITFTYSANGYAYMSIPGACVDASAGTVLTDTTGDDDTSAVMPLPFPFTLYGAAQTHYAVSTNGNIQLFTSSAGTPSTAYINRALPSTEVPNGMIAAFWDDTQDTDTSNIRTLTTGTAGSQVLVVEWNGVWVRSVTGSTVRFQAHLLEGSNVIEMHYCAASGTDAALTGGSATIGIENNGGTSGMTVSHESATGAVPGTGHRFTPSP